MTVRLELRARLSEMAGLRGRLALYLLRLVVRVAKGKLEVVGGSREDRYPHRVQPYA